MGLVQLNATSASSFKQIIAESVKLLPAITEAGYTGYGTLENGFAALFLKPNGTIADFNQTFAPFFNLSRLPGIQGEVAAYPSTWDGYVKTFLRDPNIGTNIQDTSRLLTTEVIQEKAEELAEFIVSNKQGAGFNFSKSSDVPETVMHRAHSLPLVQLVKSTMTSVIILPCMTSGNIAMVF